MKIIMNPDSEKNKIKTALDGINIILEMRKDEEYDTINFDDNVKFQLFILYQELKAIIEPRHRYICGSWYDREFNKRQTIKKKKR